MRRVWIGLLVFWGAVIVGSVVLLLLGDDGPDAERSGRGPGPCTCEALGARAKRCARELLGQAAALARERQSPEERASAKGWAKVSAVRLVLGGAIDDGSVERRCRSLRRKNDPLTRAAWDLVRRCWPEQPCGDFARCLRRGAAGLMEQAGL